jgi:hypothetical protein
MSVAAADSQTEPSLAHRFFASHAKEDANAACHACEVLEADGVGCWLAARDLQEGSEHATNSWAELESSEKMPAPRGAPAMAYDPVTRRLIMFGGADGAGTNLNDTWAFTP